MSSKVERGIRVAQQGMLLNAVLAVVKLAAGVLGHSYALVADGIESVADIFSSLVVWSGLRIASRSADPGHPYGYGKAEALSAAVVAFMLLAAAIGIAIESVREILTPHHMPAPFTLVVLVVVMVVKERLFRRVLAVGKDVDSTAVRADAWHHRADVITSGAAFVGISVALILQWPPADDYAALLAAGIIAYNGVGVLQPAVADLMDRAPAAELHARVADAATSIDDVRAIEKLKIRKVGMGYYVDLHVQAEPAMSLHDAHILSGRVKSAIRDAVPEVQGALIHMEPFAGKR